MVEIFESVRDAWDELWHHKLRTVLTLLGMIFGVGAVIAMLSIGEGAEQEALELIDSMGLRNVIINAKKMDKEQIKEIRSRSAGLNRRDLEVIGEAFPFVEHAAAEKTVKTFIVFGNGKKSDASVIGITPNYFNLSGFETDKGRLFDEKDNLAFSQVAVIGSQVAREMFNDESAIGQLIKINHLWVEVVGVLEDKQLSKNEFEGVQIGTEKDQIFLPLNTVLKKFRFPELDNEIDAFKIQVNRVTNPTFAALAIEKLLTQRHSNAEDFEIVIPAKLMEQHRQTRRIFTIVMSCVAGISLLVGGIGIMNIMLATVLERTKEIGLLRAVGARKKDVMNLFMVESFTIAAIGGLMGIFLGFLIAQVIAFYAGWSIGFSMTAVVLSVGVCAVVGLTFGIYPAIKASKMDPIEALQRD